MTHKVPACFGVLIGMLLFSSVATRAALPEATMTQLYSNCMGTDRDSEHAAYCSCVRDEMRDWSEEDYNAVVAEAQDKAHQGASAGPPARVAEVAKACITKVFR